MRLQFSLGLLVSSLCDLTMRTVGSLGRQAQSYSEGFLTQVLNPKGVLFYLSIFPQFIDFHSHAYFKAFELISIHAGLMIVWFGSTCFIVSNIKYLQYNNKITRWVQRLCGSALLIFSILLLKQ
jgi:threonine/homoserine/homoserine lactone efflux protein